MTNERLLEYRTFVGRREELARLREIISNQRPTIGVVYGRRRIGKSFLIKESLKGCKTYFFEGLENRPKNEQIKNFLFQLGVQLQKRTSYDARITSWREAFYTLFESIKEQKVNICLDEFQWMANYRSDIVSDLKSVWDGYFSGIKGITLLVCGSIASFMIKKFVRSSSFYGRTDLVVHLKPFTLDETAQMLPQRGSQEVIEAHLFTGGVPKYIELLAEKPSIRLGLRDHAFTEAGYFVDEYSRIFVSHFGRNPEYQKIIETLAQHPMGLSRIQIAEKCDIEEGGGLSEHLRNLEAAGFLSSKTPFDKKKNSRKLEFYLNDAYLRFYFSFIKPSLNEINSGISRRQFDQIVHSPKFHAWLGFSFEFLCLQHAVRIAEILGFSGIQYKYGHWFRSSRHREKGIQIDLIFSRADHILTMCEMKYHVGPVSKNIIIEVDRKVALLRALFPRKTVQPVLITLNGATRELEMSGYFYRIIKVEELVLGVRRN